MRSLLEKIWFQVLCILVVSSIAAAITNSVRPEKSLNWIRDPYKSVNPSENIELAQQAKISPEEFKQHVFQGIAVLLDARKAEEFSENHISGAINIPAEEFDSHLEKVFNQLPMDGLIIIYCEGNLCESSNTVYEHLVLNGFDSNNLRILYEGWEYLSEQSDLPFSSGSE